MDHTHTETDLPIENQYPKLVRDKIPAIIERDGQVATTHIAGDSEYINFLLAKLVEEASELKDTESPDHQKEELADVREVLGALQKALGFSEDVLKRVQASKFDERGGFEGRIILDVKPE
jgi:predicted house-cleaning noncanonical NTP pyrophosphatase (MazG superfamily)